MTPQIENILGLLLLGITAWVFFSIWRSRWKQTEKMRSSTLWRIRDLLGQFAADYLGMDYQPGGLSARLFLAAENNSLPMAEELIRKKADVNIRKYVLGRIGRRSDWRHPANG